MNKKMIGKDIKEMQSQVWWYAPVIPAFGSRGRSITS
jgi:hypothetical protein